MGKTHYVRIPVKNAYNIRDLGGYSCSPAGTLKGVTKWNTFLRGDDLAYLDRYDIELLLDYGVRTVVDLRSPDELASNPDPFSEVDGVDYFNFPLMAGSVGDITTKISAMDPALFISDFYIRLVQDETELLKKILDTMAYAKEGAVLFHCTVGKDRTGVVAAMLLGIAGVKTADIISNYEVTYTYNCSNPNMKKNTHMLPLELMLSKAEYLENTIEYINEKYKTINEYLTQAGISADTVGKIQNRFVDLL